MCGIEILFTLTHHRCCIIEIGKYGYWTKYKHIVTRVNLNFIYPDFFRHIWVKKSCKNVTCLSSGRQRHVVT